MQDESIDSHRAGESLPNLEDFKILLEKGLDSVEGVYVSTQEDSPTRVKFIQTTQGEFAVKEVPVWAVSDAKGQEKVLNELIDLPVGSKY